jgi:hypothetical protein
MRASSEVPVMRVALALTAVAITALATEARAQDVAVSVEPEALTEGARATLLVHVKNPGAKPLVLTSVELSLGHARRWIALTAEARGTGVQPRADAVVTAVLTVNERAAIETPAAGRAFAEPVVRAFGPETFVAMTSVLAAGAEKTFELEATPLVGSHDLLVSVGSFLLEDLRTPAGIWAGGVASTRRIDLGGAVGDLRLRKWVALGADEVPGEVLVPEAVGRVAAHRTDDTLPVAIAAAPFSSTDALARIEGVPVEAGYSAKDALWGFDTASGSWLVSREGKPLRHTGTLAALVHALSRAEVAPIDGHVPEALAADLEAAGITRHPSTEPSGSHFTVGAKDLAALVAALQKNGFQLDGLTIVERKKGGPVAQPEQGTRIPCLECQVLHPGLAGCAACGGKGFRFQPARMGNAEARLHFGSAARKKVDAAPASERVGALRAALNESLLYGKAWAAGWDGRSEVSKDETIAGALEASVRAELRLATLEAEAKAR